MPSVKFPLFSLDARGHFGTHLYFQRRRGNRFSLAFYKSEKILQSTTQMFFRRVFGVLAENWRIEHPDTVSYYTTKAAGLPATAFNLYYKDFFHSISTARCGDAICGLTRAGIYP